MVATRISVVFGFLLVTAVTAQEPTAQAELQRGLALLHEFEYEDANEAFRRAQALDPARALAYWGEAMTYHQSLWRHEDVAAGRHALERFAPTPAARARKAGRSKEADLLAAVDTLFGSGDAASRRRQYADAMRRAYDRNQDDPDIAALYALSLLGTMSRSLIGSDDSHEGRSEGLAGSETQAQVADILGRVLKAHPDHRGALHYLLHDYDDPEHARLALDAARAYSRLKSESSHALHMPAHIFLQLGIWSEAAASDRAAFDASTAWVRRKRSSDAMRNYHALAWLQYELLQLGRYRAAEETIGQIEPIVKAGRNVTLLSDLSSMRARYVVETERWSVMASERTFGNVNDLFAIGLSAVRTGNANSAETARRTLAVRAQAQEEGDLRPAIAIMERELAALIALAAGRRDEAIATLQAAAQAEIALPPPLGLPAPIEPAPELLGEVLLQAGKADEAIGWFAQALRRNANRSRSVLGLARAAAARGDTNGAREQYRALLANYEHADSDLLEVGEAREAIQTSSAPPTRTGWIIAVGLLAAVVALALRGKRRLRKERSNNGATKKRRRTEKRS